MANQQTLEALYAIIKGRKETPKEADPIRITCSTRDSIKS